MNKPHTSNLSGIEIGHMIQKRTLGVLIGCLITIFAAAQDSAKKATIDTSTFDNIDIEDLFNELDALLDSLTAPRNFLLINIGMG